MESEHMGILSKFVGTHSEREVKRVLPIVDKIESLEPDFEKLSDEELRDKTREFKSRLAGGETLDDILPEAYAAVREAAKRTIGMRHYRVQLIGGVILHQGRITEMRNDMYAFSFQCIQIRRKSRYQRLTDRKSVV